MEKSTRLILRIISFCMFLWALGNVLYGLFYDWTYNGIQLFGFPRHWAEATMFDISYLFVMVLLFSFSFIKKK